MNSRIFPIRDVENLILARLDFWARRRLAQVNSHYQALMAEDLVIVQGSRAPEYYLLLKYMKIDQLAGVQWVFAKYPDAYWPFSYSTLIKAGAIELLQWRSSMLSDQVWIINNLIKAVQWNQLAMAQFIWEKGNLTLSSEELPRLVENIVRFSPSMAEWVEARYQAQGTSVNWTEAFLRASWEPGNPPLLLWLKSRGVDFSTHREKFIFRNEINTTTWAEEHLGLDFSPFYEQIYHQALNNMRVMHLRWLFARGFQPTVPTYSWAPGELEALGHLYEHHRGDIFD